MKDEIDYKRYSVRYAPNPRGGGYLGAALMPRGDKTEFPVNLYDIREIESGEGVRSHGGSAVGLALIQTGGGSNRRPKQTEANQVTLTIPEQIGRRRAAVTAFGGAYEIRPERTPERGANWHLLVFRKNAAGKADGQAVFMSAGDGWRYIEDARTAAYRLALYLFVHMRHERIAGE